MYQHPSLSYHYRNYGKFIIPSSLDDGHITVLAILETIGKINSAYL
jgi:hypothetical protein